MYNVSLEAGPLGGRLRVFEDRLALPPLPGYAPQPLNPEPRYTLTPNPKQKQLELKHETRNRKP